MRWTTPVSPDGSEDRMAETTRDAKRAARRDLIKRFAMKVSLSRREPAGPVADAAVDEQFASARRVMGLERGLPATEEEWDRHLAWKRHEQGFDLEMGSEESRAVAGILGRSKGRSTTASRPRTKAGRQPADSSSPDGEDSNSQVA